MKELARSVWMTSNLLVVLFLGLILSGGEGVRIKELRVPDIVLNGTDKPVVLDCDYSLDIPVVRSGLVVKWFFNNHPAPVYQWIFTKKPQYLGVLKNRVNEDYRATNDEATMYRGFQISVPTVELSGEYKCLVSTFDKEDSRSKKMVIYVPEKTLELKQEKPDKDKVVIHCAAEGVFPEPNMTIVAVDNKDKGLIEVTTRKQNNSSLYDIKGSLTVDDDDLPSPTTFMCELSIPPANYMNRKEFVYLPANGSSMSPSLIVLCLLALSLTLVSCRSL